MFRLHVEAVHVNNFAVSNLADAKSLIDHVASTWFHGDIDEISYRIEELTDDGWMPVDEEEIE